MSIPSVSTKGKASHTFDAIVIGSGISGGWAAKEFCEKGLQTLVLERGRNVEHGDYPTAMLESWQRAYRGRNTPEFNRANPILTQVGAVNDADRDFFVPDAEHPYVQKQPFSWIKGYQVGGKSLLWARWTQRWSEADFEANSRDGHGVDWPIRYRDLAPWYSYVEKFVGIAGNRDGLPQIPDGEYLPPMEMNALEKHLKAQIETNFPDRNLVISRTANLTQQRGNRGPCQYRSRCNRGCPYAGYFSSNSATLPAANATGRLTMRPFSVVHSIIYDETQQKAVGVRVIDTNTLETTEFFARVIFVNAATINSTLLLLNSTSERFPQGLGNDSAQLGRNLMDHNYRVKGYASHDGFKDRYYSGRRPTGVLIPKFRNVGTDKQENFLRGYAFSAGGMRNRGNIGPDTPPIGAGFKKALSEPGSWGMWLGSMAEMLPHPENRITLSATQTDRWGMPQVEINAVHRENEEAMVKDMLVTAEEMFHAGGFRNINVRDSKEPIGLGIHEMGTARMGRNPRTSVLNAHNAIHAVPNVYVTDGACMTSSSWQNPSITYMALTARAVDHAVQQFNRHEI
ncbi:MAG: GMC family oxidoreductase [Opitutaceae bacterium]|jgi:choline dehydrogenase-like flavoprotein|nr:GMC family oxidoreductase [Opitutaceae bacterium]